MESRRPSIEALSMQANEKVVSNRSVERLYHPQPHFFRYFVNKPQKRSALVNRECYLRMCSIDAVVRRFLQRSAGPKTVINLGCGSDVLPWQCFTRYPDSCGNAVFVDVDHPELITKKNSIVRRTKELHSALPELQPDEGQLPVILRSKHYYQIGCDLRQIEPLFSTLSEILGPSMTNVLWVADASLATLEAHEANNLIRAACDFASGEFCLLEQIAPGDYDHPYAKQMLEHYQRRQVPLKSIYAYGDTGKQEARVTSLGWRQAEARSLWEMWSDDAVVPQAERKRLDTVEPFDEWEDFHLFASHYMLLHASNRDGMTCELRLERVQPQSPGSLGPRGAKLSVRHHTPDTSVTEPHRRHAAGAALRAGSNCFGFPEPLVVNLLGTGSKRPLLPTMDVHSMMGQVFGPGPDQAMVHEVNKIGGVPSARTHHATCDLERAGTLLVGGRAPSGEALRDCWLLIASQVVDGHKEGGCWQRTHDLPIPLYRHTLAAIGGYSEASVTSKGKPRPEAIVMGGKTTSGRVSAECFVFDHVAGWRRTRVEGDDEHRRQVFGATLWSFPGSNIPANKWQGLLIGGLRDDGTFSAMPVLGWQLEPQADSDAPKIKFMEALATERKRTASNLNRFGAVCIVDPEAGSAVMVGGMTQQGLCPKEAEVVIFEQLGPGSDLSWNANVHEMCLPSGVPRPLLSGISLACPKKGLYVMMGGGTAGGSFGTLWNSGTYTIVRADDDETTGSHTPDGAWKLCRTLDMSTKLEERVMEERVLRGGLVTAVRRVKLDQTASFEEILHGGQPVIFEGLDLGTCVDRWSTAYLVGKIGRDKKVVVHKATTEKMDFNAKNFQYVTTEFGRFLDEVDAGGKQYLRALSVDKPAESPANLAHDFPEISDDFVLPASLDFVTRNLFSSVLRISGPVHMWLHYDVMANVYCQIRGTKRLLLFPPSDVTQLGFAPGASSSSMDVIGLLATGKLPGTVHAHEAVVGPGDVLFLPALWPHAASVESRPTATTTTSIAVNVFFRNLDEAVYSRTGRDVYGNRDVAAYERGRQLVANVARGFAGLPRDVREFYMRRLAEELLEKARE